MDKKKQELLELVGHAQNMKRALYRPQFGMLTVGEFLNAYRDITAKKARAVAASVRALWVWRPHKTQPF